MIIFQDFAFYFYLTKIWFLNTVSPKKWLSCKIWQKMVACRDFGKILGLTGRNLSKLYYKIWLSCKICQKMVACRDFGKILGLTGRNLSKLYYKIWLSCKIWQKMVACRDFGKILGLSGRNLSKLYASFLIILTEFVRILQDEHPCLTRGSNLLLLIRVKSGVQKVQVQQLLCFV